jgi:hypothetical protein
MMTPGKGSVVTKSKNRAVLTPRHWGRTKLEMQHMKGWWWSKELQMTGPTAYITGAWVVARGPNRCPVRGLCKSHNAAVASAKRYIKHWKPLKDGE